MINFFLNASYQIQLLVKLQQYLVRKKVKMLPKILQYYIYIVYNCDISPTAKIGKNLSIAHPSGIVIGAGAVIGNNVKLFQQVTLGSHGKTNKAYPVIEDDVVIYAGAKVIGGILIGRGSVIGANAVVIKNIPSMSIAVGVPAVIRKIND